MSEDRDARREGDSLRANVYRKKDEVLTFAFEDIVAFGKDHDLTGVYESMGKIRANLQKLDEDEQDQKTADETIALMATVRSDLDGMGFKFPE